MDNFYHICPLLLIHQPHSATGFTTKEQIQYCYLCNSDSTIVGAGLQAECETCVKGGSLTQDALLACLKTKVPTGGADTTKTTTSATEAAAMAAKKAAGQDPCSATGLSDAVKAACKECYTVGMTDATLVACVNGKLATTAGTPIETLKKYAVPIAAGVLIVGVAAIVTHGKYWGKKGPGKPPVPARARK